MVWCPTWSKNQKKVKGLRIYNYMYVTFNLQLRKVLAHILGRLPFEWQQFDKRWRQYRFERWMEEHNLKSKDRVGISVHYLKTGYLKRRQTGFEFWKHGRKCTELTKIGYQYCKISPKFISVYATKHFDFLEREGGHSALQWLTLVQDRPLQLFLNLINSILFGLKARLC